MAGRCDHDGHGVRSALVDHVGDVIFVYDHGADRVGVEQCPVQPDLGAIADTLEPEPVLLPSDAGDRIELCPVPPVLGCQIGDGLKVFSKEDVLVHVVRHQPRQNGRWHRDRIPTGDVIADRGNSRAGIGHISRRPERTSPRQLRGTHSGCGSGCLCWSGCWGWTGWC